MRKLYLSLGVIVLILGAIFYNQFKKSAAITIRPEAEPIVSLSSVDLPDNLTDQMLGNPGAPTTIVEFADLGNSASNKLYADLSAFASANGKDVRFIWKDLPSAGFFEDSALGHEAAYCAGKQNKFWTFVDKVIGGQYSLKQEYLAEAAKATGLDAVAWDKCLADPDTAQKISSAVALAQSLGIQTAPALFINNKKINLTADVDVKQMLNSLIAK